MRFVFSLILLGISPAAFALDCVDTTDARAFCLAADKARACILGGSCDGKGDVADMIPTAMYYMGKTEALATRLHENGDLVGQVRAKLLTVLAAITDPVWDHSSPDGNWRLSVHRSNTLLLEARERLRKF